MNVLVTGGLGFIGSHTAVELIGSGHAVVIADNLINSKIEVLDRIASITGVKPAFYKIDVADEEKLTEVFESQRFEGVLHFAGLKSVGESVSKPLTYYYNNLVSTMTLAKLCLKYSVLKFVFSSSATVYGDQPSPLREEFELKLTSNPYGETKAMSERILMDTAAANPSFGVTLLRYFNPIGAHDSGLIGEDPNGIPNNLMPYITKVASGKLPKLRVFGNDYQTVDGTGVRDYLHVVDLAKGHVRALEKLIQGTHIYNLGTGRGTSVIELIEAFRRINCVDIPYEITNRRPGDLAVCFADPSLAEHELGWKAALGIEEMVRDSWRFEKQNGN